MVAGGGGGVDTPSAPGPPPRGEVAPDRDWSLIADVLTGMGLMRVIGGQSVDATFVRDVIDTLILPAVRAQ